MFYTIYRYPTKHECYNIDGNFGTQNGDTAPYFRPYEWWRYSLKFSPEE